jgi:hypothetical protein
MSGLLGLLGLGQIAVNYAEQNLSRNTIIEDAARNMFDNLPVGKPIIFISHGDTVYFALRYLQALENLRPDILVMNNGKLFPGREFSKYPAPFNRFQIAAAFKIKVYDFEKDILRPNLATFTICTDQYLTTPDAHTAYYPLGRCFTPGQGLSFGDPFPFKWWRHDPDIIQSYGPEFREDLAVFSLYAIFYLQRGITAHEQGRLQDAHLFFEQTLALVPYALPAQYNLCQLLNDSRKKASCLAKYEVQRSISFDYLH